MEEKLLLQMRQRSDRTSQSVRLARALAVPESHIWVKFHNYSRWKALGGQGLHTDHQMHIGFL